MKKKKKKELRPWISQIGNTQLEGELQVSGEYFGVTNEFQHFALLE